MELPPPKLTTKALVDCAYEEDLRGFIVEHRRINRGISMAESREDYERFRELIGQREDGGWDKS